MFSHNGLITLSGSMSSLSSILLFMVPDSGFYGTLGDTEAVCNVNRPPRSYTQTNRPEISRV